MCLWNKHFYDTHFEVLTAFAILLQVPLILGWQIRGQRRNLSKLKKVKNEEVVLISGGEWLEERG